jgi:hypothetical protein
VALTPESRPCGVWDWPGDSSALLRQSDGVAVEVLSELGVSLDRARQQVVLLLDEHRRAQEDQTG